MNQWKLELHLPLETLRELERIAQAAGLIDAVEAAKFGLLEWISRRKAELDNQDPAQKYFVNEALDELFAAKK
jgi:hypothetical protein